MSETTVQVAKQDVTLFESHVELHMPGGMKKAVSIDDFKRIMNDVLGHRERASTRSFLMPSNVYYFSCSDAEIKMGCYYQARKATIKHFDRSYDIVLPNTIISHTLTRGVKQNEWQLNNHATRYLCTKLNVGNLPTGHLLRRDINQGIYLFPTTNVYDTGEMCFGGNSMPIQFVDNNLRPLDWYYQFLFESPFNDDLGVKSIGGRLNPTDWYKTLAGHAAKNEPFPYEHLR